MDFLINILFIFDVLAASVLVTVHTHRADRKRAEEARAAHERREIILGRHRPPD